MKPFCVAHLALTFALIAAPAFAHEQKPDGMPPMSAAMMKKMQAYQASFTPGAEHRQLADQFQGNWTAKTSMWMDPSMPPMTSAGTATSTVEFGGRQVRSHYKGDFMASRLKVSACSVTTTPKRCMSATGSTAWAPAST